MNISAIEYKGGLRTEAVHLRSGKVIVTDAPTDNKGRGEAFSPTDLLATSLGCCALTIMGIKAAEHGLDIDGTRVRITKIMESNPRRVGEIVAEFDLPKNNFSDKDKRLLENSARACPVAQSLSPQLKQTMIFNWQ